MAPIGLRQHPKEIFKRGSYTIAKNHFLKWWIKRPQFVRNLSQLEDSYRRRYVYRIFLMRLKGYELAEIGSRFNVGPHAIVEMLKREYSRMERVMR